MTTATESTLQFVLKYLNPENTSILEVGCGSGELAIEIQKLGADLTAIDMDEDAISAAVEKGVNAVVADFLEYDHEPFDVLIFTRSLHHIHDLDGALMRAKALLKPGGMLLLEEFDLENVNEATLRWYYDQRYILASAGLHEDQTEYVRDPVHQWQHDHHHGHPLHTGAAMTARVRTMFDEIEVSRNPYLYRSICSGISDPEVKERIARSVLQVESGLIDDHAILPNGMRLFARKS